MSIGSIKMLVTLMEICENSRGSSIKDHQRRYTLREISINPDYVICVREDLTMHKMLSEGQLPEGLDTRSKFSRVTINRGHTGSDIVVVGARSYIEESLFMISKQLLKG